MTIKIATIAPSGSPWHIILQEMGEEWKQASNGLVELRIYPGGVAGNEQDMIRKMRIGQLQAAAVSNGGLAHIDEGINVLVIPMVVDSWEILDKIREALGPEIKKSLEEKGFILLNWGDAGWVRYFGPSPDPSVESAKKSKLFVTQGDDRTVNMWKKAGFNAVPLAPSDILMGLQTGMIDAFNSTAVLALASQWFVFTPYMVDMPWAPMIGATIVTKKAWEQIPADIRVELEQISVKYGERLQTDIRELEEKAVVEMEKRGLVLAKPSEDQVQNWRNVMELCYPLLRTMIPKEWFDIAVRISSESRELNAAQ
ncbi:TRAP transporter substrate-binding protein DctP [candidate division KSB1 bacterium]|nr:TRAP transporter substrate-binding protein DctP [candidate division KSB1 bacterium]